MFQRGIEGVVLSFQKLTAPADGFQQVVVERPSQMAYRLRRRPSHRPIGLCPVLLLFMLASGDLFSEKLIKVMPTLADKKRALGIAREIEYEVSRYLATIGVINVGLGTAVGVSLWARHAESRAMGCTGRNSQLHTLCQGGPLASW